MLSLYRNAYQIFLIKKPWALAAVRKLVPYLAEDVCLTDYLEKLAQLIKSSRLLEEVEEIIEEKIVF